MLICRRVGNSKPVLISAHDASSSSVEELPGCHIMQNLFKALLSEKNIKLYEKIGYSFLCQ
jgi:hypothetical protein